MNDSLSEQVFSAIAKVKHIPRETITPERTLESLALDSLDTLTLLFELEDATGLTIPDDQLRGLRTVGEVVDRIRQLQGSVTVRP